VTYDIIISTNTAKVKWIHRIFAHPANTPFKLPQSQNLIQIPKKKTMTWEKTLAELQEHMTNCPRPVSGRVEHQEDETA